ncbi:MAG: transcription-repair coupling factor [Peptoniphilaceae bacterium]
MNFLTKPMDNLKGFKDILNYLENEKTPVGVYGTVDGQVGHLAYNISEKTDNPILILVSDSLQARKVYEDLKNLGIKETFLYLKREVFFYDRYSRSLENMKSRIKTLENLSFGNVKFVVSTIDALKDKITKREIFKNNILNIELGKELDLSILSEKLVEMGYERYPQVEGIGQFAIRGSILDIYSPDNSYRIELFDVEVDSIRSFDISTQRSIENLESINILPTVDFIIKKEYKEKIRESLEIEIKKSKLNGLALDRLKEKFSKYIDYLKDDYFIKNTDLIIPFIEEDYVDSILDYFNEKPTTIILEPNQCLDRIKFKETEFKENLVDLIETGEVLKKHENLEIDTIDIINNLSQCKIISLNSLTLQPKIFAPKSMVNLRVKTIINYRGKIKLFISELKDYMYRGYKVVIMAGNKPRATRLVETLKEFDINVKFKEDYNSDISSGDVIVTLGSLREGFEISDIKFVLINHNEIYGTREEKKKRKRKSKLLNFEDLNLGDYVVHESYGIGKYVGTQRLTVQGVIKDYILIEYKGEDKLFLPIENLDLIYKYTSKEGKIPKINKLNSIEWSKTKSKAKGNIEDIAEDLIKLYAKRMEKEGFKFSEDTQWQKEFEDSFEFEETEGQLLSSQEIKLDMESPKPMDRLLCADVGYGKTEVALRAAFKAIMDGKQVAFLVPTTILAQQHYNTTIERFKDFPISVALLSRFRSKKEQKEDLEKLKEGYIDIIIGTHRLLSKDVKFKDIGLLIVDEEQRFGVKHKEKIKLLKDNIDSLTLTATPIPRTLQMSMIGIRDMSVIDEPPEERFPVQTYVSEYNNMMIREAILKEIERGGQVYFVYNRVSNMENKLLELKKLLPEVSFGMAHGQMNESLLENTMISFINHEFDVLLCSTIIETGMDVRNANTMIVTDANRLGLSQLYQLRGRIGRSNKIAYAYFTYEKNISLSEIAQKRLRSIKEFTEFGSGYKIALRDLELRGSGNILGARQSGHIDSIGYDLYIKYLKDALSKLKGEEVKEEFDTTVDLKLDSYIPSSYIKSENNRIEIYKKIADIKTEEDYSDLVDELIDRFSEIPIELSNLMDVAMLRSMAMEVKIKSIIQKNEKYEVKLDTLPNLAAINEIQDLFKRVEFDLGSSPSISIINPKHPIESLKNLVKILKLHKKDTNKNSK